MTLRIRLLLLLCALVAVTVSITAAALAVATQAGMRTQAVAYGEQVADLLARAVAVADGVPDEVEGIVGGQMVTQARLTAHLVAAAEAAGETPEAIAGRLRAVVASSPVDEFWVSDAAGHAYIHSLPGVDFTFSPDPEEQPQASAFWPLMEGGAPVIQDARAREIDGRTFKYVGVPGVDGPRIVQVGQGAEFLADLRALVGVENLLAGLRAETLQEVMFVAPDLSPVAGNVSRYGDDERTTVRRALADGRAEAWVDESLMRVVAPVTAADGVRLGALLIGLPTDVLSRVRWEQTRVAVVIAAAVLLAAFAAAVVAARRVTGPVNRIAAAAQAIEAGDFRVDDLGEVARKRDELGRLARVFGDMAREVANREDRLEALVRQRTQDLAEKNDALERAQALVEEELEAARQIQMSMLPATLPQAPQVSLGGRMIPARRVGGDFYDAFRLDERRIGVVVGDVSGKGVGAALFMALSQAAIRAAAEVAPEPDACMARANEAICAQNPLELFVSVFYAVLDLESGTLAFSNGGHPPPYLIRSDGRVEALASSGDLALGVLPDTPFAASVVRLQPGDVIFLHTDGLSEAMDENMAQFGDERLMATLRDTPRFDPAAVADAAVGAVVAFRGDAAQSDDLTCLAVRWHGAEGMRR